MKSTQSLIIAAVLGVVSLTSTFAADIAGKGDGPVANACRQDIQALCPDTKPGDGRLKACVRKNHSKLSDDCKDALKAQRKNPKK